MPRLIEHDAEGPLKLGPDDLDPEKGDVAICLCGLSADFPFCDGSHRKTHDEDPERLYRYDGDIADGTRRVVDRVEFIGPRDPEP